MSPKRARQKGIEFELKTAQKLRCVFPAVSRRLEFQKLKVRGIDLDNTGFYKFQCKKLAKYVSVSTIKEIEFDALLGEVPVLVTAGTNMEAMAVLPFDELVRLLKIEKEAKL